MAEVLVRHLYLAFVAAFVAYSVCSVLQPIRDVHDVEKFQVTLCVNYLSRILNQPPLCDIMPVAMLYQSCDKRHISADIV